MREILEITRTRPVLRWIPWITLAAAGMSGVGLFVDLMIGDGKDAALMATWFAGMMLITYAMGRHNLDREMAIEICRLREELDSMEEFLQTLDRTDKSLSGLRADDCETREKRQRHDRADGAP